MIQMKLTETHVNAIICL